ncbi:MAG: HD domain-containing protein [Bacteriovorax sp.]|nr:HD domain-containing protein [Bacteriovorax sp.]
MTTNVSQKPEAFSAIPLSKIACNDKLQADVFIKIGEKFIKFKEQGDFIPEEKYNYFISMNVKELFVLNAFKDAFQVALEELKKEKIETLVTEVGEGNRTLVEQQVALKEIIYETFLDEVLSNETVEILKNQVTSFIEIVKNKNPSADIFLKISSMNNTVAEHSMNVANLSLLFGMAVGQNNPIVLENLYMGALFHDYGKAKIPESVSGKPNSIAYEKAIKNHPEAGVEMLKKNPSIPQPVLTIVAEHHEQFSGVGYPKGISKDAIYGLSRIVAIANVFDNVVTENRHNKASMYKAAIKVLEYDKGKQFDSTLLPRILDVLKLSLGNFNREREKKAIG